MATTFLSQRRLHLDQLSSRRRRVGRTRKRGSGSGAAGDQHGAGGMSPDCRHRCHRRPGHRSHQFQGRETEDAPQGRVPRRPAGPHLRGVQHVN